MKSEYIFPTVLIVLDVLAAIPYGAKGDVSMSAVIARASHHRIRPSPSPPRGCAMWIGKIANPDTCPDAPRYKGCGNGWATNQPRWILTRLLTTEGVEW